MKLTETSENVLVYKKQVEPEKQEQIQGQRKAQLIVNKLQGNWGYEEAGDFIYKTFQKQNTKHLTPKTDKLTD